MSCEHCGCDCYDDYVSEAPRPRYHTHPIGMGKSKISIEQAIKMAGLGWKVTTIELGSLNPDDLLGLPVREE